MKRAAQTAPSDSDSSGSAAESLVTDTIHHLARLPITPARRRGPRFIERLRQPEMRLAAAYRRLTTASPETLETSRGAEWLLDNHHIVRRALRQLREEFPRDFERRLPRLAAGDLRELPRIYALAREIAAAARGPIDLQAASSLISKFQLATPLAIAEVWALPPMLRLVVFERLAGVVDAIAAPSASDRQADAGPRRIREAEDVVATSIRSLRVLETTDWKQVSEEISVVEAILRQDPAGVYTRMDFETRDRYRKTVEDLAARSSTPESAVAQEAIRVARSHAAPRALHVGYHLIGPARHAFERHLGYRPAWKTRLRRVLTGHPTAAYIGGIGLLTLVAQAVVVERLLASGASGLLVTLAALLACAPAATLAVSLINGVITRLLPPSILPKMNFESGIPSDCLTLVAVPVLLTDTNEVESLCRELEIRFLANPDPHLRFALVTDLADAGVAYSPEDAPLVELAEERVRTLNARHGKGERGPFHLLHRPRVWSDAEHCWMGHERKRGKLSDLNRLLLSGTDSAFSLHIGEAAALRSVRFVITLDADTELPRGAAARLVGTLAHPLNRAQFDPRTGVVVCGYTVLQPRIEISPLSAATSLFSTLFAGGGLDPYTRAVSDVYQDLFGEGVYTGKGIYDVRAFEDSLAERVPEGTLLSHDLFEGINGRAGLVSDVALIEDYPSNYLAYTRRLHRWARGDWQLLPWLRRRVPKAGGGYTTTRLSLISRWKILDNLRRSLFAPCLLALLLVAWMWFPGPLLLWTLVILSVPAAPGLTDLTGRLVSTGWPTAWSLDALGIGQALRSAVSFWGFEVVFLAHQASILCDAIGRTVVRLCITRRSLLEWTSAAHTRRSLATGGSHSLVWREMIAAPLVAAAAAVLLMLTRNTALPIAAPLLVVWALSPEIAWSISRPRVRREESLTALQRQELRMLALRTWAFFDTFVGPQDQWLPPDHFQEYPRGVVARRTSPTNIGLALLATIAAYDLGYRGLLWVVLRLKNTFDTLDRMERYRGHLLNWYDTATLTPLQPRYISTVDSGNLVASALAVKQSCIEYAERPVIDGMEWEGFLDTLAVLDDTIERAIDKARKGDWAPARDRIATMRDKVASWQAQPLEWHRGITVLTEAECPELDRRLSGALESSAHTLRPELLAELRSWSEQLHQHLGRMQREMDLFLPWLSALPRAPLFFTEQNGSSELAETWAAVRMELSYVPRLAELPGVCAAAVEQLTHVDELLRDGPQVHAATEARGWITLLIGGIQTSQQMGEYALDRLAEMRDRAERIVAEPEFGLLFDRNRRLFHIGYNVTAAKLDDNHYDLLASEARLTSFVAIAKGDVPEEHWLHLGRPIGRINGFKSLLSWSGTMFEYLMPTLLLREPHHSVIRHSCDAAIGEQIVYARERGVPWGISESGYYRLDAQQNYQYRAFGVPALGFKRGLEDDLVVAPYASVLALPLEPRAVLDNLGALRRLGLYGRYGLYEAVDFTWSRIPPDQRYGVVRSFMAHHQGMVLVALNNFLRDGVFVRRFHAEPMVRTAELLLCEELAHRPPLEETRPPVRGTQTATRTRRHPMDPWPASQDAPVPQTHVLSNGRYALLVTDDGSTASRWQKLALTRWISDSTLNESGFRTYLRQAKGRATWPLFQRTSKTDPAPIVVFHPHMVERRASYGDIAVRESITVAPSEDVEIRYVILSNEGKQRQRLYLTSYGEVVLNDPAADRSHPAFNKLFIDSEYVPSHHALLFRRRSRSSRDETVVLLHMVVLPKGGATFFGYEGSRERFLGRGGTLAAPAALGTIPPELSRSTGATLDPVMALSAEVDLPPRRTRQVAFVTLVANTRAAALALADSYRSLPKLEWVFELARNRSESELRRLKLDSRELPAIERTLSLLLYPHRALRADLEVLQRNTLGRSGLWKFAISGDLPILLLRLYDIDNVAVLHEVLRAHAFWRGRGIAIDLVILSEQTTTYSAVLDDSVHRAIAGTGAEGWMNRPGGVFVLHADQLTDTDRTLLMTSARVLLDGAVGSLAEQVTWTEEGAPLPALIPTLRAEYTTVPSKRPNDLLFGNDFGGFTADGKEYIIHLEPGTSTPAPWVNVIANPGFGFLVSEAGGGYSWAGNSGENRLTPWSNDPVCDTPGETLYLRDEETADVWSATPAPAGAPAAYDIHHAAGYTIFRHTSHDLMQELRLFVPREDPVKIIQLTLVNRADRPRRVTATYYAEWVLGAAREVSEPFVIPAFDSESEALLARNPWNEDFAPAVAFLAGSQKLHGFTTDRSEFFGRFGRRARPQALDRIGLANAVQAGTDPCAAAQMHIDLAVGESKTIHFMLGQGSDREHALDLVKRYRSAIAVESAREVVNREWDRILGQATVRSPDPAFDIMLNRWLLYQLLASRIWSRTGFYQSNGAFGFRDQLQDVAALLHVAPELCRAHLLECGRHQFEDGDVLHWWHPPSNAGIRTRCSDDLVWLPYITALYVRATGDRGILSEEIPFLRGDPLRPEEADRYGRFARSDRSATLYRHCLQAIKRACTAGPHGVPLFGSGDWNDGMNRVGALGRGESVWLGWFLVATLTSFARLCEVEEDRGQAEDLLARADTLRAAIAASAWDGGWYRRGYYDDGRPLGSSAQNECRIDSIAQSWAVLSGAGVDTRAREAMTAVCRELVRETDGLILLLAPPFNQSKQDPGYIAAYPPGIRENGGQYTHAAVWVLWALVELGEVDLATRLFGTLLPPRRATGTAAAQYRVEPYVLAADVYSTPPHTGRGGWTWYTGSAGWAYRFGWEQVVGLRMEEKSWRVDPHIPWTWDSFTVSLRDGDTTYEIRVDNPNRVTHSVSSVTIDGVREVTPRIPRLSDGATHNVRVVLG